MERREFLQSCSAGLCSCAVAALFAAPVRAAAETSKPAAGADPKPAPPPEDRRIRFMQDRCAVLLTALSARVETATLNASLQEMGAFCASSSKMFGTLAGKPDEFLAMIREKWQADARYDPASSVVTLAFAPSKECPCPLVKTGVTPPTICQCSIGWQRRAFETVYQRDAKVALKGSLLAGDDRCSFEIKLGAPKSV